MLAIIKGFCLTWENKGVSNLFYKQFFSFSLFYPRNFKITFKVKKKDSQNVFNKIQ